VPEIPGFLKNSIVDVKCTDQKGRIFIVEMQMLWTESFQQRMVFGASQAYVKQLGAAREYAELRPVYALAILNNTFRSKDDGYPENPDYYHHYKVINAGQSRETAHALKGLEFVIIELPKFTPETRSQMRLHVLWLRFLREVGAQFEQVIDPALTAQTEIAQALKLVERHAFNQTQLDHYHRSLDRAGVEKTLLRDATAQGKAEGIAQGIEQGAHAKAQSIAAVLLAQGMSEAQVASITGLGVNQVRALRQA
jgi:predicted transposase/invertase (TIGR01784 family)